MICIPSAIDISDRTRSETELRDSELRFRRVFDSAADGLICVDQQGRITLCNPRALEMFGYSAEELNNQPIEMLVPSELTTQHQTAPAALSAPAQQQTDVGTD